MEIRDGLHECRWCKQRKDGPYVEWCWERDLGPSGRTGKGLVRVVNPQMCVECYETDSAGRNHRHATDATARTVANQWTELEKRYGNGQE